MTLEATGEATGGYERRLCTFLEAHAIAFAVVNPARIRAFARARGYLSKTDMLDAKLIQCYGQLMSPPQTRTHIHNAELRAFAVRRAQLVAMISSEKKRLKHPACGDDMRLDIEEHLVWLAHKVARCDAQMEALITKHQDLKDTQERMVSVPGIADVTARALLAYLPELGHLHDNALCALAGLAPHANESGTFKGTRRIKGGRPDVRRTLYLAAIEARRYNPPLKAFADQLKKRGKAPKQILIAVARKLLITLNALIRKKQAWQHNYS